MIETIAAILALATGPNHVYVYGSPNLSLECAIGARFYVDTAGNGVLVAGGCTTQAVDWLWWPDFPLLDIRVRVDAIERKLPIVGVCSFVAHANNGNGTTSTVIDCR